MVWLKLAGFGLLGLCGIWALQAALGAWHWPRRMDGLHHRLAVAEQAPPDRPYDPAQLDGLPPPVARYLRKALTPGQPLIRGVEMAHQGRFNMGQGAQSWKPFTSRQRVTTARPGFVWDGCIAMAPGLPVRVIDAYVAGEGLLYPAILGMFPLARIEGGGAIAEGELQRWLAESPWYPTVLLPGGAVTWTALDDQSALARVSDGGISVALTFTFGPDDMVSKIRADARGRTVGDTIVPTPWEGTWWSYTRRDGMAVPTEGEVAWVLPEGPQPYWQGRVTELHFR